MCQVNSRPKREDRPTWENRSNASAMHLLSRPLSQETKTPQSPLSMIVRFPCGWYLAPPYHDMSLISYQEINEAGLDFLKARLHKNAGSFTPGKKAYLSFLGLAGRVIRHGSFLCPGHLIVFSLNPTFYVQLMIRSNRRGVCSAVWSYLRKFFIIGEFPFWVSGWTSRPLFLCPSTPVFYTMSELSMEYGIG